MTFSFSARRRPALLARPGHPDRRHAHHHHRHSAGDSQGAKSAEPARGHPRAEGVGGAAQQHGVLHQTAAKKRFAQGGG